MVLWRTTFGLLYCGWREKCRAIGNCGTWSNTTATAIYAFFEYWRAQDQIVHRKFSWTAPTPDLGAPGVCTDGQQHFILLLQPSWSVLDGLRYLFVRYREVCLARKSVSLTRWFIETCQLTLWRKLPYGARIHRASWSSHDFANMDLNDSVMQRAEVISGAEIIAHWAL